MNIFLRIFFSDTYKEVAVKCLLLDESGQLKSDNCFEKHRVICATGNVRKIFELHMIK